MKTYSVKSLPLKEVIRDLAEEFETLFVEECNRYIVKIPAHLGKGFVYGINFSSGLGIIYYECTFLEDVEIQFNVDSTHPVKFLFCLTGNIGHQFVNEEVMHNITEHRSAIVASSAHNGHVLRFKSNVLTSLASLEIDRILFLKYMKCELEYMSVSFKDLFYDVQAKNMFYYEGYYSLEIADIFTSIARYSDNQALERMLLEGKSYQILVKQIEQLEDDNKDEGERTLLRKSELNQILKAAGYIKENLGNLGSIPEIAKKVGLNPNKLQQGFRYYFGKTVNEYILSTRLEIASTLLMDTDMAISEIVYKIGFNSLSYISKIFNDHFGMSPSKYRKLKS
tara:strand:- start:2718 stop:3731 length:1014 start_codon:yes stop_codon:yes gene_type:complete